MSDIIETLLLRNLQVVFGEGDPARRRAAIEELYTEDCTVFLPIGRYVGRAALDQVAGELRDSHPSFVYTPHRPPQAVQDSGRLAWGSGPPREPPRYTGLDVIVVRDEKIAALCVFLDSPPV
jgi:SnoaL-like domain